MSQVHLRSRNIRSRASEQISLHVLDTGHPEKFHGGNSLNAFRDYPYTEPLCNFHEFANGRRFAWLFHAMYQPFLQFDVIGPKFAYQAKGFGIDTHIIQRKSHTVFADEISDSRQARQIGIAIRLYRFKHYVCCRCFGLAHYVQHLLH